LRKVAPPVPPTFSTLLNGSNENNFYNDNNIINNIGGNKSSNNKRKRNNIQQQIAANNFKPGSVRKTAFLQQHQKKDFFHRTSLRGGALSNNKRFSNKRGRPSKLKEAFDGSSDASNGSLDTFIPTPKNFEGFNNPFRDVDNCLRTIETSSKFEIRTFDVIMPPPVPTWDEACSKTGLFDENSSNNSTSKTGLFDGKTSNNLSSIFCSTKKCDNVCCNARRLTLDGEIQYLVDRDLPQGGPVSPRVE
jgi:hypothetical protein